MLKYLILFYYFLLYNSNVYLGEFNIVTVTLINIYLFFKNLL